MTSVVRFLRLLSVVVWVGGIVFFAFVVAPVAFWNLATAHDAGLVVRGSILALHWIGLACGAVFLVTSARLRPHRLTVALVTLMLAVTALSQFYVLPAMERDRAGSAIEALDANDPHRLDFERKHVLSERLEGLVLLLGLGVVGLLATAE